MAVAQEAASADAVVPDESSLHDQPPTAATTTSQLVTGDSTKSQTAEEAATPKAAVCGVCEINPPKYKCPRCYLPYCSVACNKVHRENHPPDEPKPIAEAKGPEATAPPVDQPPPYDPSNPFRALDTSDRLQHLFRKYPGLSRQLDDIYAATQPPPDASDKRLPASLMQGVVKKDGWNHDIGIKNGKEALRRARRADGAAGEAVREYSELILHLINNQDEKGGAATVLQQQAALQDSELIEKLLAQEKR